MEVKALTTEWGRVGGDKERVGECNDYIERKKTRHHRHDVAAAKAIKLKEEMRESAASKKKIEAEDKQTET